MRVERIEPDRVLPAARSNGVTVLVSSIAGTLTHFRRASKRTSISGLSFLERFHQFKGVHLKGVSVDFNPSLYQSQWAIFHTHVGPGVVCGRKTLSEVDGEVSTRDRITFQLSQFQGMNVVTSPRLSLTESSFIQIEKKIPDLFCI